MEATLSETTEVITLILRMYLGLFFLTAAIGKLANHLRFVQGVLAYDLVLESVARPAAALLPWGELALALGLMLGIAVPIAAFLTAVLLLGFILAISINLRRGRAIPCSCYGIAGPGLINWGTVIRNIVLLGCALFVATTTPMLLPGSQWITF